LGCQVETNIGTLIIQKIIRQYNLACPLLNKGQAKTQIATKTSRRILISVPDTEERVEDKGSSLVRTRNAVDGALIRILRE
jgi:hypothetical protein